ncbi:MAG: flagellar assembly protein FliW [Thermoflexaceae bacterium]|nr:flagellar assembly protein FliW [Thermoflexaceae bacterium]
MLVKTKCFGDVEIADEKIIRFENGLMGFEDFKEYTLLFDSEKKGSRTIMWLQSIEEQALALPVVDPLLITENYDPVVEDELLSSIGEIGEDDLLILVTLTVPGDITKMTANYKAPIIINAGTLKGVQLIAENEDYLVKHPVYDILKARKDGE